MRVVNESKKDKGKKGRAVSMGPRHVDDCASRATSKQLYAQVQTREKRDESVMANARRAHSRRQKSQQPQRGRSPARSSHVEYTGVGKRVIEVNVPFRARPGPHGEPAGTSGPSNTGK